MGIIAPVSLVTTREPAPHGTESAESEERYRLLAEQLEVANRLLRATVDSMLDPQMLLEAVRDPATGQAVDFIYREANAAACKDMATTRDELIGRTVLELLPGFAESGPLHYYVECLETGQPGALDDYAYDNEAQASSRRYDTRIAPAGKDLISITFRDVTDRFEAARRIAASEEKYRILTQQLQQQSERVKAELDTAAAYMASIMPRGLQGPVTVSSRYLPSRELGGDCLDYYWIDDDHLLIKLIDVSGHGLEPALLAVSVHNLMRSGSLPRETLLSPEVVLTELNRLFAMEQQSNHYFTMWYGIYEASTRTLRYANAGAPPALAFNAATGTAVVSTVLSTPAAPVGVFEDTEFTARTYEVPPGCRILVFSDGASEITVADGQQLSLADFRDLTHRVAASSDWSVDNLIDELRALTLSGIFEDDFSLIQLAFD